jgi:hypothetical protein
MESLGVFYRILDEDLSPLISSTSSNFYLNYLKERHPDFIRQKIVRLARSENSYEITEINEKCFCDIKPMHSFDSENVGDTSDVLNFILKKLSIDNTNILNFSISNDGLQIDLKLLLQEDYAQLSDSEAKFYFYQVLLKESYLEIVKGLNEMIFALYSEEQIHLYIKKFQTLITGYMKTILHDLIPYDHRNLLFQMSAEYTNIDIFKITYQVLEDIQVYIEKSFAGYFDTQMPAPYQSRLLLAMEYEDKLKKVLCNLELVKLDYPLREIVIAPFERLNDLEPLTFSYHNHTYHEVYVSAFYLATEQNKSLSPLRVLLILWQLNFNALKFFNYLTSMVYQELKKKNTLEEKLGLLYYYQKLCNQQPIKTKLCYNPNNLSLKDQMSCWLQEEISFQKRNLKYYTNRTLTGHGNANKKTLVKMSVPQLSLFTRAIFESGLLDGSRQAILTFICQNFRTDQQENISVDSLRGKYYKVDTSTKRSVGRIVKKMLVHLESAGKNY